MFRRQRARTRALYPSLLRSELERADSAYSHDQTLGQCIGKFDVRCTFNATISQWKTETDLPRMLGLLYFNMEFKEQGNARLKMANVKIDVGHSSNDEPIPIFTSYAPLSALTGAPVQLNVTDIKKTDPQCEATSPWGGLQLSGRSHEVTIEYQAEHRWFFKAGAPSDGYETKATKADFTWTRTSLQDCTGLERSYEGALVLRRDENRPIVLQVTVAADAWSRFHRTRVSKPKRSDPIGPPSSVLSDNLDFVQLQSGLQDAVVERNKRLGAASLSDFVPELSFSPWNDESTVPLEDNDQSHAVAGPSGVEEPPALNPLTDILASPS